MLRKVTPADFPTVHPMRQRMSARFKLQKRTMSVSCASTTLRVRMSPGLELALFKLAGRDRRLDVPVSVRVVGQTDDLSTLWQLALSPLDNRKRVDNLVVLELSHRAYEFDLDAKGVSNTPEFRLYRAFVEGHRLGVKMRLGPNAGDFGYCELAPFLVQEREPESC